MSACIVRWYKNDGHGNFGEVNQVSTTAFNAQGVTVADIDGDGDLDLASASSGDNTVAWYENLLDGRFCEVKTSSTRLPPVSEQWLRPT